MRVVAALLAMKVALGVASTAVLPCGAGGMPLPFGTKLFMLAQASISVP